MDRINLAEKFGKITAHWDPKIIARLNGQAVKLAKIQGEFDWHHHEHEDELFMVIDGSLTMQFRDRAIEVGPGEVIVVPAGVEHCPRADEETQILLFEPESTLNTGNIRSARTRTDLESI